ncbi:hypothetical protein VIGAN_01522600 [Vigna angularis var. angularis]|uniref:Uncharacterized protein n=1 Tax=Vigna angularis var. angularis TaxID=157739 RepID=A0A0S3R9S6_PHAAN|nr:hypothetical protein VIGAN_01522600 [Vigna angularis var. angularis]
MSASKFSALVLFVIILLCSVLDSHSTSRLENHIKLRRNLADNRVSSMFANVYYDVLPSSMTHINKISHPAHEVPNGPNPGQNTTPPVPPSLHN